MVSLPLGSAYHSTVRAAMRDPLLWVALLLGAFVRLVPVLSTDFPLNDGGLFASIIDQLVAGGWQAPTVLQYNGADIPFAYPPLGFYLGAVLVSAGLSTLDVLRFVPVTLAILIVPAWYLLARELFGPKVAGIATLVYALVPKSYEWLVSGGGITRALGLLFAILALRWIIRGYRSGQRRDLVIGGVLLAISGLSHPEAGVLGAATAILLCWVERTSLRRLVEVGIVALLVASPWLAFVLSHFGFGPLLAAGGSRGEAYAAAIFDVVSLQFTHEVGVPFGALLGVVGLFVAATTARAWLLGWIAVVVLVAPAASPTFVMLPFSAGAGVAAREVVMPRLTRRAGPMTYAVVAGAMVLSSVWSAYVPGSVLHSIRHDVRESIDWIAANAPEGSRVAVVTGVNWRRDAVSEWFPYLSRAVSVGTVQGSEFTDDFASTVARHADLQSCASRTVSCIVRLGTEASDYEWLFIPVCPVQDVPGVTCHPSLLESVRESADTLHDGPGGVISRWPSEEGDRPDPQSSWPPQAWSDHS